MAGAILATFGMMCGGAAGGGLGDAPDDLTAGDAGDTSEDSEGGEADGEGLRAGTVSYTLRWALGRGVERTDAGLVFTTDLGYVVTLSRAEQTLRHVQLVACEGAGRAPEPSVWRQLAGWLVPSARAGHPANTEPTVVEAFVRETLGDEAPVTLGPAEGAGLYCHVHYLVSQRLEAGEGGADADMVGKALVLEGTWARGGAEPVPFTVDTPLSYGVMLELPAPVDLSAAGLEVHLVRHLSGALDGIDFEAVSAKFLAQKAIAGVTGAVTLE